MAARVLIVEDIPESRSTYQITLSLDGHTVDVAQSKSEALELISKRSYDVAVVDLRLAEDDEANMEGLDILEALHDSREGTALIVLSGHGTVESSIKAYEKFNIKKFFTKENDNAPPAAIRKAVSDAIGSGDLARLGKWSSLSQLLTGGGENQQIWEGRCLSILDPEGIPGLYALITGLLGDFLPVLPRRADDTAKINESAGSLELSLWSKGRGTAVYGELSRNVTDGRIRPGLGPCLKTFMRHGIACSIWEDPRSPREDFVDSIWR